MPPIRHRCSVLLASGLALLAGAGAAPVAAGPLYPPERERVLEGIDVRVPPDIGWRTNPIDVALPIMRRGDREGFEIVSMTLYRGLSELCRERRLGCAAPSQAEAVVDRLVGPVWLAHVRGSIRVSTIGGVHIYSSAYFLVRDHRNQRMGFGAPYP